MPEKISVLGTTGSIGNSSLEIVRLNPDKFEIEALSCNQKIEDLAKLAAEFLPKFVCVGQNLKSKAEELLKTLKKQIVVFEGASGMVEMLDHLEGKKIIAGICGSAGLISVNRAVELGKTVVLANKEPLVIAGKLIMAKAKEKNALILPIDSEHNAVYQCLQGNRREDIKSVTLTASGGPFLFEPLENFARITPQQALKHPNWVMGPKVTIDSATLMNKALEVIEACRLFDLPPQNIHVVIHPQSIIHSYVAYKDNSVIAQMGDSDMKIPISYCLSSEGRIVNGSEELDLLRLKKLEFYEVDQKKFPTLSYANKALQMPSCVCALLNGANEFLVQSFLEEKIKFLDIFSTLEKLMRTVESSNKFMGESLTDHIESIEVGLFWNQLGERFALDALKS